MLWRRALDGVIVARPEWRGPDPVTVTGGGAAVWELLDRPRTRDELVAILVDAYGADPAVVDRDVAALLADLEQQGYVEQLT